MRCSSLAFALLEPIPFKRAAPSCTALTVLLLLSQPSNCRPPSSRTTKALSGGCSSPSIRPSKNQQGAFRTYTQFHLGSAYDHHHLTFKRPSAVRRAALARLLTDSKLQRGQVGLISYYRSTRQSAVLHKPLWTGWRRFAILALTFPLLSRRVHDSLTTPSGSLFV